MFPLPLPFVSLSPVAGVSSTPTGDEEGYLYSHASPTETDDVTNM
jgi:hypothetical protein